MFSYLLNLIYPNVCGICNKINLDSLCNECKLKIKEFEITRIDNYKNKEFKEHIYIFKYKDMIRNLLLDYKFNDKIYLYKTFSRIIINNTKIYNFMKKYDIIMPVPLHKKRLNVRGYNQCNLILKDLRKKINIDIRNDILFKTKNNAFQSTLNKKDRLINIKNVYLINNNINIAGKKILIFDDIYTTGSTANECARILNENGAREVGIFTIAKD